MKLSIVRPDSRFPSQTETFTKRKRMTSQGMLIIRSISWYVVCRVCIGWCHVCITGGGVHEREREIQGQNLDCCLGLLYILGPK